MAEVLITLAIIGIVAALTIPTLVSKNEKKQLHTQFMKSYNTLVNAFNMSVAENGTPNNWSLDSNCKTNTDKYLAPYLKVTKTCTKENIADCISAAYYSIDKKATIDLAVSLPEDTVAYALVDGSVLVIQYLEADANGNPTSLLSIDANGKKGPNTGGRDVFSFEIDKINPDDSKSGFGIVPRADYKTDPDQCDPSKTDFGDACSSRLLIEGGMNY